MEGSSLHWHAGLFALYHSRQININDRMLRLKAVLHRALSLALVVFIGLVCVGSGTANADGSLTPPPPSDALTRFESFILANCFPCVRESYYIEIGRASCSERV